MVPPDPVNSGAEPPGGFARTARRWAPLAGFLLIVTVYYLFVVSAGTWTHWRTWTVFYDAQAEGFRQGHLYLPEVPSAALQALPDPYNPANMRWWRWDHVYYGGHFYMYWGLVPALFLAAFKAIFHIRALISDDVIVFLFFVGRLVAGSFFIRELAGQVTVRPPGWAVWLAMAVFAIAHPTPYLLARCGVYEGAIVGGVCFMVVGLTFAFRGIVGTERRASALWLAGGSIAFGLAAGTRISLFPTVAALVCLTAFVRWRIEGGDRNRLLPVGLAACGPAAALAFAHLVLNRLRFGAFAEFGSHYQLGWPMRTGFRFTIPDLFAYLFCPPTRSCTFPFLFGNWNTTRALAPSWLTWPVDHQTGEPSIGLMSVAFYTWFAVGVVWLALGHLRRRRDSTELPPVPSPARASVWRDRWIWGALILYVVGSSALLLVLSATTVRYEADFASGLLLIATLVGWRFLSAPATRAGRATTGTLYVLLAVGTLVAGALLGFTGYFEHFKRHNPALLQHLEKALSFCHPR